MDPFGLIAVVVGAGFVVRKLFEDKNSSGKQSDQFNAARTNRSRQSLSGFKPKPVPRVDTARPHTDSLARNRATPLEPIEVLPEYRLVKELVQTGFPIVFVTGGAGTGKSTFITWLVNEFDGQVLVAAPTGIAALNVKGQTLHGLCKLPHHWLTVDDVKPVRREAFGAAKLLIIDEVSMVNANLMDAVSHCLKISREVKRPFGGLPVVLVGDLFQLPPIIERDVQEFFDMEYPSTKFFGSHSIEKAPYYAVELRKAFRQVDQTFVDLLAKLREGEDVQECVDKINSACQITNVPPEGAVWLCPRNQQADGRNRAELEKLPGSSRTYVGSFEGQFKPGGKKTPSPETLVLRVGAQVMFTKNSMLWVNGTVGKVVALNDSCLDVLIHGATQPVEVTTARWDQYEYAFSSVTGRVEAKVVGSFIQIPLMPAWAITIHKSQGQTIDRVHIDLGVGAFASGQTYVALSRCRSLQRMTLSRKLGVADIIVDGESQAFYSKLRELIASVPPEIMSKKLQLGEHSPVTVSSNASK